MVIRQFWRIRQLPPKAGRLGDLRFGHWDDVGASGQLAFVGLQSGNHHLRVLGVSAVDGLAVVTQGLLRESFRVPASCQCLESQHVYLSQLTAKIGPSHPFGTSIRPKRAEAFSK